MQQSKKTLVVGATPNETRYAYKATAMLGDYGHERILYGIKKGSIQNIPILNEWPAEEKVDTVTLYINPTIQKDFYDKILALKPKRIIFNPGTENTELTELAAKKGIEVLNACTLVMLKTNNY